jgi:hypothetical protein
MVSDAMDQMRIVGAELLVASVENRLRAVKGAASARHARDKEQSPRLDLLARAPECLRRETHQ